MKEALSRRSGPSASSACWWRRPPRRRRPAQDRPEGLRDPEEPRQPVLHDLGQRQVGRRARRAAGAQGERERDERHGSDRRVADPGDPGRDHEGRERAARLGDRRVRALPDAEAGDGEEDRRRDLRLGRAGLPQPVHQPGRLEGDRHERGRSAREADQQDRRDRDPLGRRLGDEPERLDRVHEDSS